MSGPRRLAVVFVAVFGLLQLAAPARADEVATGCPDDEGRGHNLSAWAYYTTDGQYHQWYQFRYLLWGTSTGGESNVNIWVRESFDDPPNGWFTRTLWQYYSPDTLDNGVLYTTTPSAPVSTFAVNSEQVDFQAIFDRAIWRDPRCTTSTPAI